MSVISCKLVSRVHVSVTDSLDPCRKEEPEEPDLLEPAVLFKSAWRLGEEKGKYIVPIFKEGKEEDLGNYRPVSLPLIPGKIMEQVLQESLVKHREDNQGIRNSQHGFPTSKSCLTNLISFYDKEPDLFTPTEMISLNSLKKVLQLHEQPSRATIGHNAKNIENTLTCPR